MILFACILQLLFLQLHADNFKTLKDFTDYANKMPEYPVSDTLDWQNPVYTKFHQQITPGFEKKVRDWLHLKSSVSFPVNELLPLLHEVIENLHKLSPPGRLVKKVFVDAGGEFYIWGEINGAFHSLVRTLNELEKIGLIDNNFHLLNPKAHIILIGDILNRSPYLIETAFLILRLMQINPRCPGREHDSIFYMKGKIEDKQEWLHAGLARELQERISNTREIEELFSAFGNFFNSVPLAIYLMPDSQKGKIRDALRISYYGPDYNELDESSFLYFFDDYARPVTSIAQRIFQETAISLKIRAYIFAASSLKMHIRQKPLSMLSHKKTVTEWTVFSSPTAISRRLYEFFDDAFILLKIPAKDDLGKWTLTQFHQDVRTLSGFIKDRPVYLLSGEVIPDKNQEKILALQKELADVLYDNEALKKDCTLVQKESVTQEQLPLQPVAPGEKVSALQGDTFVIGSSVDLSRQFKIYNEHLVQGMNLAINKYNRDTDEGGGKKVRMVYLDDGYEPKRARANIEKFLHEFKTDISLSSMGTGDLAAYIDLVKAGTVFAIFPNSGGFRRPDLTHLVHLRTSYVENGRMVARAVAKNLRDKKKVAFFYQDDEWGKSLLEGAKTEFEKEGLTNFLELPFLPNSISFTSQAEQLKKFNPDGLALFCGPRTVQELVRDVGVEFLERKVLFGDTVLGLKEFSDYLKEKGLQLTRAQVVPNPQTSQLQVVKEFRDFAAQANVPVDIISLEGYLNAQVFLNTLDKVKDDFSTENFIKAFENIKKHDLKGLKLDFDPQTRQLLHTVWINTGEGDWKPEDIPEEKAPEKKKEPVQKPGESPKEKEEKAASGEKAAEKIPESVKTLNEQPLSSVQGNILKLGSTMDLSKEGKSLSDNYRNGMLLKLNAVNAAGGVNSLALQLNIQDDLYDPAHARANVEEMIKDFKIDLFLAPLGTPTTTAYLDLVKEGKILVLFPIARSLKFRQPDLPNMIQYQPSTSQEASLMTKYMLNHHKIHKLVFFYQHDEFGQEPKEAVENLLKKDFPKIDFLAVSIERNNVNFSKQVNEIKKFKPDAIALQTASSMVEEFVRQIGPDFLHNRYLYGGSWLITDPLIKFMKEKGLSISLLSLMPNPETSDIELAEEFKKTLKSSDSIGNVISFEGFLYMSLLVEAVEKITPPLTKQKIIDFFQHMQNVNFKGLMLSFNHETRSLIKDVWVYKTGDNSWTKETV